MEAQTQTTSLSELVSDHGPHKWPRILSRLALLVATGEHMAVRVGGEPCPSASGNGGHVVIVGGIRLIEEEVTFDKKGSLGVNCDCKAFEFGVEPCCKHVIVALVAAVSKLAAITHVSEDEFVDMLEGNNSNKQ